MTLSTNPKVYRFVQWVMFAPLLLPLCVVVGAFEGIQKMAGTVIEQFKTDEKRPEGTDSHLTRR